MLILAENDLRQVLKMADVLEAVEGGFRALARGDAFVPPRLQLEIPESSGVLLSMPSRARLGGESVLGTKTVSVFENNPARGIDSVQAVYLLNDGETGAPLALMEGRFITAVRTAATSALATRLLASGGKKRLAIFGSGVQARFHIEAMLEVAEIESIMISSRTDTKSAALRDVVTGLYNIACDSVPSQQAVSNANLICTCTGSSVPVFEGELIRPGTHINAVGAFTPSTRELDSETIRRARVFIDMEEAAGKEAGDLLIPIAEGIVDPDHVKGTLAELVTGKVPGRNTPEEITVFKSSGVAIEDLVTARLAFERASERGIGTSVRL